MNANENLINDFYSCFKSKDFIGMQKCYADNAIFNDEVFLQLDSKQVKAMWAMLCKNGKDLQLEFSNVRANENKGSADWVAKYTFSATGKNVVNHIHAEFEFLDGKIISHTDAFSFYKWSSQAFGLSGKLLGWTSFLRNKVRARAMSNLMAFMNRNQK